MKAQKSAKMPRGNLNYSAGVVVSVNIRFLCWRTFNSHLHLSIGNIEQLEK